MTEKSDIYRVNEGRVRKGGVNPPSTTPRPPAPKSRTRIKRKPVKR